VHLVAERVRGRRGRARPERLQQREPLGAARRVDRGAGAPIPGGPRPHREHRLREVGAEAGRGADVEDAPVLHQRHAVAAQRLVHVRRGHHDREAVAAQRLEQVPELAPGHGIDARRGLVEEEELGAVHERAAEGELLLHPSGERARAPVGEGGDLPPDGRDERLAVGDGGAEHRREEPQVLLDAQVGVEREPAGHVPDALTQCPEVARRVEPQDRGLAARRHDERREDAEERRLAGAVGADHAVELPRGDLQRHVVERARGAVRVREVARAHGGPRPVVAPRRAHGAPWAVRTGRAAGGAAGATADAVPASPARRASRRRACRS
jgi:hypothetical protein